MSYQFSLRKAEFDEASRQMLYDFGRLEAEVARLQTENERLTAELAQARQWAGLWKESAHNFRRVAAMWRSGALRAEALVAAADDERLDLAPVYDEETG